ncbi:MAG: methylated-DNA--[protein]-cysteine S-methyltransferase [Pseudomonadota bacterium]
MKYAPDTVQRRWKSPLGMIAIAATPRGVSGMWFEGQRHWPAGMEGADAWPVENGPHAVLDAAEAELDAYFAGRTANFRMPLDLPEATPFQHSVWQALLAIRPGDTCSYSDIAHAVAKPAAVRAVGAAVGRNPVSIVVPCHRVLGSNGSLTGYAGGLDRKQALLALESRARRLL